MKNAFCLLNHTLTEKQIDELRGRFCVSNIVYPPQSLSKSWSQISAQEELDKALIDTVISWLSEAKIGDILIVQGEAGSTFVIVDYALKNNLVPVHAVTTRVSKELKIGEQVQKQNVFEHVCFRKYTYYS